MHKYSLLFLLKTTSLLRNFFYLALLILVSFFILTLWLGYKDYIDYQERTLTKLTSSALRLSHTLSDDISYTSHQMNYIVNQIKVRGHDAITIASILASFRGNPKVNVAISWNMFSWVNAEDKLAIDGNLGILQEPVDVSTRDYLLKTKMQPNKLFIGAPVSGAVSQQWIIPAGMGVLDQSNHYMGSVVFGFDVGSLIHKLEQTLVTEGVAFIVFDNQQRPVIKSTNIDLVISDLSQIITLYTSNRTKAVQGVLSKQALFNDQHAFVVYEDVPFTPFSLVLVYDKEWGKKEFRHIWPDKIFDYSLIAIFVLGALTIVYLKLIRPMLQLAEKADAMARGQKVEIPKYHLVEVDAIGNQLQRVQDFTFSLQGSNAQLESTVQERTAKLKKALGVQTEFLNNLSHEIRIPVQSLMSIADGLVREWDSFSEEERKQYVKDLHKNTHRLFAFLTNILDLASLQAGKMHYSMQEYSFISIVTEVVQECQAPARIKNLQLYWEVPTNISDNVICDKVRISEAIRNVIMNAIKYSDSGIITIKIAHDTLKHQGISREKENVIILTISDEGPGIPEEELEEIFRSFTQSTRTKTNAGGTGLGLSITQEIILSHRGKIKAENHIGKKGCTFTITIPSADSAVKSAKNLENSIARSTNATSFTILIIDDEPAILQSVQLMLYNTPYLLVMKESGREGLEYLYSNAANVDLVLLDLMIPDIYGLTLLETIRNTPQLAHLKVIMQTGLQDDGEIKKLKALNIQGFLAKPYHRAELLQMLETVIQC